jgi:N-ethylmaleimide reductase
LKTGAALAEFDPATLYGGGSAGYTDYPVVAESRP